MNTREMMVPQTLFSNELIRKQVQKIFAAQPFCNSPILRNFLQFVIDEYAAGRSEHIKEYTIATHVMSRSADFNPQADGIVRIHARRLRMALESYYQSTGSQDELLISIPKGRYKPFFALFNWPDTQSNNKLPTLSKISAAKIAVLPFKTFEVGIPALAFSDSLGQKLSNELGKSMQLSVISYHLIRELSVKNRSIENLSSTYGAHFVITGNVQFENQRMRVSVQLINNVSHIQIWSEIYHLDFSSDHYFELTDILVARMMDILTNPESLAGRQLNASLTTKKMQHVLVNG